MSDHDEIRDCSPRSSRRSASSRRQRPDYERIRDLFIPAGLLIRSAAPTPECDVEEFIAPRQATSTPAS